MRWNSLAALALAAPASALIRFGCSQLVIERLDPLVTPGLNPSPHLHQIIGGVSAKRTPRAGISPAGLAGTVQEEGRRGTERGRGEGDGGRREAGRESSYEDC